MLAWGSSDGNATVMVVSAHPVAAHPKPPEVDMPQRITLAHSPDADDAFMFYALATGKVGDPDLEFVHVLEDIQTLNERAFRGEYEVTALSFHAYAYLSERYALLPHGASMGDGYGPMIVAREPIPAES